MTLFRDHNHPMVQQLNNDGCSIFHFKTATTNARPTYAGPGGGGRRRPGEATTTTTGNDDEDAGTSSGVLAV